ncbi:transcriptional regulator [Opitutaceae bacterium EW11]|nr:transcriptional regulator [Opitutaceae bacterium EW11]
MSSSCFPSRGKKNLRLLSEEALSLVARRFAILSEPMRLHLLHLLVDGELSVTELVTATGGTQANISRHLHTLADAGLIHRRKDGLQVFYSIADASIFDLCNAVCSSLEKHLTQRADVFHAATSEALGTI